MNKRRRWTAKECAYLRELYDWWPVPELAALLLRSFDSVRVQASKLGLKVPPAVMARRRSDGLLAMYADPAKSYAQKQALSRSFTPERRAQASRNMREVIHVKHRLRGHRLSEQGRANIIAGRVKQNAHKIGVAHGHPLRAEYQRMVGPKKIPAAEARRMIAEQIARLPKHEQQIIKIGLGQARVIGAL